MSHNQPRNPAAFRYVLIAVLIVGGLGGLTYGYDQSVLAGALLFLKQQFQMSDTLAGFVTSSMVLGGIVGAMCSGVIADRFGRRTANIIAITLMIFGVLITVIAPNVPSLIIGRIILGLGIGAITVVAPLYIAEISPPHMRGAMVTIFQIAMTLGILLAFIADTVLASDQAWRWMFALNLIPAGLAFLLLFKIPQSPRWLIGHQRNEDALHVLQHTSPEDAETVIQQVQSEMSHTQQVSWRDLFDSRVRKAVIIGLTIMLFQQISGINTVFYYAPFIFEAAGITSETNALIATTSVGVMNFLMTAIAIFFVDRWGRRPLFLLGLIMMVISLTALGGAFYWQEGTGGGLHQVIHQGVTSGHTAAANLTHAVNIHQQHPHAITSHANTTLSVITIICLFIFISSFSFSLGPISFVIVSEIFPNKIRSKAISLALMVNWIGNFFVAQTFLIFMSWLGVAMTFWFYALTNLIAMVFVFIWVPETKGYTLEEIESRWLIKGERLR